MELKEKSVGELLVYGKELSERYARSLIDIQQWVEARALQVSDVRREISDRLEAGETTGDHIKDMVILHYGLDHFDAIVEAHCEFEKRLAGHKGEFVLVSYKFDVQDEHVIPRGWRDCWRFGVLEGEQLIETSLSRTLSFEEISIPVSRYIYGDRPVVDENIFHQHYGYSDPSPTMLGLYILKGIPLIKWPESIGDSRITELVIGDDAFEEWRKKNPRQVKDDFLAKAKSVLRKFDLEPMDENEGPLPNEEFADALIDEYRTRPLKS